MYGKHVNYEQVENLNGATKNYERDGDIYEHEKFQNVERVDVNTVQLSSEVATSECVKKNRKPTNWIFLQKVEVSHEYMKQVYITESKTINKKMFTKYKNSIAKDHIDPIVGCIALIRTYHVGCKKVYKGKEELSFWMYCQHLPCNRTYRMTCDLHEAEKGIFNLFRSDDEQIHTKYLTRQIRQACREKISEKLLYTMPMELRRQNIHEATDELLEQKNLQNVASAGV